MTNFVTSLSILCGHLDHSTSQGTCCQHLHDQSIHVMGPICKQLSDTQCILLMHRHCGLHQLRVAPSQVRCSLELHFVGGSSKRIGYFDWSRELVLRIWYFTGASALGIGYLKLSATEPTLAGTRFFKRVEPRLESGTRQSHPSLDCITYILCSSSNLCTVDGYSSSLRDATGPVDRYSCIPTSTQVTCIAA